MSYTARCMSEGKDVTIKNPHFDTSGKSIRVSGTCPSCGKKVGTFIGAAKAPSNVRAEYERKHKKK